MIKSGLQTVFVCVLILISNACTRDAPPPSQTTSAPVDTSAQRSPIPSNTQVVTTLQGDQARKATIKTEPILDGCSMQVASKILRKAHPDIKVCGQAYAQKSRKRPVGKMSFTLVLKKDGWPRQVAVTTDEVGDSDFTECIKTALNLRFPNPFGKECIIQAPFTFTAKPPKKP